MTMSEGEQLQSMIREWQGRAKFACEDRDRLAAQVATLTADLARVTAERDSARDACACALGNLDHLVETWGAEGIARLRNQVEAVKQNTGVTFEEFSKVNRTRSESPEGFGHKMEDWSLSDWFTAVVGELGEAANVAKKLNRVRDGVPGNDKTEEELRKNLRSEIADVFIYLDLLAQSQGISLVDAVVETFDAKSQKIGYPVRLMKEGGARDE
jgi:NTP pyrophosphatase (non-canonical NTP hydrolase)